MGQRNMLCTGQRMDLELDQHGQGYLQPEPCAFLRGLTNFPQPDIQTMVTTLGNTANLDTCNQPEHYDGSIFYGMPQYHGVQHHPYHHLPSTDLGIVSASNSCVPYLASSPGIPPSHQLCDQLPSFSNYGVVGVSADEYRANGHSTDNARGVFKRKNADGYPGNFQCYNAFLGTSSLVAPLNTRHSDGVALVDSAAFPLPQLRGNGSPSIREIRSHRSVRNRLGTSSLDPVPVYSQNHFIQGSYMGQPFQPAGSLWVDQQFRNGSTEAGALLWTQSLSIPYMHGNNVNGGSMETVSLASQVYHELGSNRSNPSFLHPSSVNLQHHIYHHLPPPPMQGMRGHSNNVHPQVPASSFRLHTSYVSRSQNTMNSSHDRLDSGSRHPGSIQPTDPWTYRPHHEGVLTETTLRHRNFPSMRVMPTDGVAVLEFPEYYEVENYVDHHRDMRLDIEDMSYEELLALEEQIGNVNTGLSEKAISSQLKIRTHVSYPTSVNLEEPASLDQEPDSCIICQDDYKSWEKIGILNCGHEYHADCLKRWLRLKNVCPICKSEALSAERNNV
uniref:RING-type E3 ubiquitin transferase n=1 Tax=Rhizophora mucronata TaxID=61149 RepID=A0A2P2LLV7_RHIMU